MPITGVTYQSKEGKNSSAESDVSIRNYKQAVTRAINWEDVCEVTDVVAVVTAAAIIVVVIVVKGQVGAGTTVATSALPQLQILRHGLRILRTRPRKSGNCTGKNKKAKG